MAGLWPPARKRGLLPDFEAPYVAATELPNARTRYLAPSSSGSAGTRLDLHALLRILCPQAMTLADELLVSRKRMLISLSGLYYILHKSIQLEVNTSRGPVQCIGQSARELRRRRIQLTTGRG
jgi:hypothetical protein